MEAPASYYKSTEGVLAAAHSRRNICIPGTCILHSDTRERGNVSQHARGFGYAHHHYSQHEHRVGRECQTPRLAPRRSATRRRDEATWTAHETRPLATRFGRQLKLKPVAVNLHSGCRSPPPSSIHPFTSLPSIHPSPPTFPVSLTSLSPYNLYLTFPSSSHHLTPSLTQFPFPSPTSPLHISSPFPPAHRFVYFFPLT